MRKLEQIFSPLIQQPARRRQLYPLRTPRKQLRPELSFELSKRIAERWLRHIQLARRLVYTARIGYPYEIFQLSQLHTTPRYIKIIYQINKNNIICIEYNVL